MIINSNCILEMEREYERQLKVASDKSFSRVLLSELYKCSDE